MSASLARCNSSAATPLQGSAPHRFLPPPRPLPLPPRSSDTRNKLMVTMLWPLVLFAAYFIALWAYSRAEVDNARYGRAEVLWTSQAQAYARLVNFRVRQGLTYCEPTFLAEQLVLAESNAAFEEVLVDQLLYGSSERQLRPGLQTEPELNDLFTKDGCVDSSGWWYSSQAVCRSFYDNLLTRGLLPAVREFGALTGRIVARRRPDVGAATCASQPLVQPEVDAVDALASAYLAAGMKRAADLRLQNTLAAMSAYEDTVTGVTCACVVMLFVIFSLVYDRAITGKSPERPARATHASGTREHRGRWPQFQPPGLEWPRVCQFCFCFLSNPNAISP